jgi:hypothetical protein
LLELAEVALDAIAFLVEIEVVGPLKLAIALRRSDDVGTVGSVYEVIGFLFLVGDGGFGLDAVDQIMGEGDVVALTGRGNQANGRVSLGCVDLVLRPPLDRARPWASAPL